MRLSKSRSVTSKTISSLRTWISPAPPAMRTGPVDTDALSDAISADPVANDEPHAQC